MITHVVIVNQKIKSYHCMTAIKSQKLCPIPGALSTNELGKKNGNSYIRERSLILTMSFILVVLVTHFSPTEEDNLPTGKMIKGAAKTIKFVKETNNGLYLQLIPSYLIVYHDDTVQSVVIYSDETSNKNKRNNY